MESFCTQCGTRVGKDDAFCPQCGVAASPATVIRAPAAAPPVAIAPATPATSATSAASAPATKRRWPYWIVIVLIAFIAGLLLGQHHAVAHAPKCAAGAGGGGGGGSGSGAGGGKLGAGGGGGGPPAGGGGGGAPGKTPGGGGNAEGGDGGGTLAGGGGGGDGDVPPLGGGSGDLDAQGKLKRGRPNSGVAGDVGDDGGGGGGSIKGDGDDPDGSSHKVTADDDGSDIAQKLASGKLRLGPGDDRDGPPDPTATQHVARDFTYDRTGLPRYNDSVRAVASAMTEYSDRPHAVASSSAIVTGSSFESVVEWYRTHLPPGWRNQTIGDLQAFANAVSTQSIANALGFGSQNAPSQSAAPPAPRMKISMYFPPANTPGDLGIMIVQQEGKAVSVLMKTHRE